MAGMTRCWIVVAIRVYFTVDENADIASGSESEWDDWEEDVVTSCQDLFSDQMFESVESMLVNCREVHGIDMSQFLSLHSKNPRTKPRAF